MLNNRRVFVDTEAYYDSEVSVQKMCLRKYWSKSYVYLISVCLGEFEWVGTPNELRINPVVMAILLNTSLELWAVNSNFDQTAMETIVPEIRGRLWRCLSDFSVYHQRARSLSGLHESLTKKKVDKHIRGQMKGVHWQSIMAFDQEHIREYNLQDSRLARDDCALLETTCGPMSPLEDEVAAHTRMLVRRGMAFDGEFIERCRQTLYWVRHNAAKEMPWAAEGEKILAPQVFNTFCCKRGVAPPANLQKDGADFTAWMEANPKLAPFLKARQRYELANRKLSHIENFLSRTFEGTYYPDLLYCGAPHTRRWSAKGSSDGSEGGGETHSGFNLQNMDREPLFGELLPDFISPLPPVRGGKPMPGIFFRNFIVPRPGKVFLILDESQIEPRVLRWLAHDEAFLDQVRKGYGVYEAFARAHLGWTGGPLKKENPELYRLAKAEVLGLGYGCGVLKFPAVALKLAGLKISAERSKEIVYGFRNTNGLVKNFWDDMQRAVENAAAAGEPLQIVMPNGETMWRWGVERYVRNLPDGGQKYAYRGRKLMVDPDPKNVQDIFGAKIVENITQRVGRDTIAEALPKLEAAGIPVCFHAHDEIIAEVDRSDAPEALIEARRVMETVPDWCAGLPIGVDGGVFERYCKAD